MNIENANQIHTSRSTNITPPTTTQSHISNGNSAGITQNSHTGMQSQNMLVVQLSRDKHINNFKPQTGERVAGDSSGAEIIAGNSPDPFLLAGMPQTQLHVTRSLSIDHSNMDAPQIEQCENGNCRCINSLYLSNVNPNTTSDDVSHYIKCSCNLPSAIRVFKLVKKKPI